MLDRCRHPQVCAAYGRLCSRGWLTCPGDQVHASRAASSTHLPIGRARPLLQAAALLLCVLLELLRTVPLALLLLPVELKVPHLREAGVLLAQVLQPPLMAQLSRAQPRGPQGGVHCLGEWPAGHRDLWRCSCQGRDECSQQAGPHCLWSGQLSATAQGPAAARARRLACQPFCRASDLKLSTILRNRMKEKSAYSLSSWTMRAERGTCARVHTLGAHHAAAWQVWRANRGPGSLVARARALAAATARAAAPAALLLT